tara:strand:+ start:148 stop:345 length:198 start_codon:yes stop_codon:yes gene_type:complete
MLNRKEVTMNYYDMIASIVEGETTANFEELMQDEEFKNLFKSLIGKADGVSVALQLSEYANNNLI